MFERGHHLLVGAQRVPPAQVVVVGSADAREHLKLPAQQGQGGGVKAARGDRPIQPALAGAVRVVGPRLIEMVADIRVL